MTSIGNSAFYGCSGLTSITYKGTTAQWNTITKGKDWNKNVPTTCKIIYEGDKDAVYTYEIYRNPYTKTVDYNITNTYVVFDLKNYQNGFLLCSTEYHHDIVLDGINNGTTEKVNKGTINVLDGLSYKGNPGDEGVDHPTNDTPLNVNWTVIQKPKQ